MNFGEVAAYAVAFLLLLVIGRIFFKPLKSIFLMVLHSVLGGVGVYLFNLAFAGLGFSLGLNMVTATLCGLFGLPGLLVLVILKFIFAF